MSELPICGPEDPPNKPQLWPVFICYRQSDGLAAARRLYELLDQHETVGSSGELIRLDVYLDQTMAAVADWRKLHKPYLEKARALLVVCSPGAKIDEGPDDWVQKEIRWWLKHREVAPILIDPLRQGLRYVPSEISERWPEIQRVPLVSSEWQNLPAAELEEKSSALRRVILGGIVPSGKAVWQLELEEAERRAERLRRSFIVASLLGLLFLTSGIVAFLFWKRAETSRRVSEASFHDAQAASSFDEARRLEARIEALRQLRRENQRKLNELAAGTDANGLASADNNESPLAQNLEYENRQLEEDMREMATKAERPRKRGYDQLKLADDSWAALARDGYTSEVASRKSADPPAIFSLELINAGSGESILIHYGTPDLTHLVMLNGGPGGSFKKSVEPRLRELKMGRFAGHPTPIELFIASDQDEHKTGGLLRILQDQVNVPALNDRLVDLRSVWANMFSPFGIRGEVRSLIEKLGVPLNQPFDHIVIRPDQGRAVHRLPDGNGNDLEIVVLGPEQTNVRKLFEMDRRAIHSGAEPRASIIQSFPEERFSKFKNLSGDRDQLPPSPAGVPDNRCIPSENAQGHARVANIDTSIPNLASTILLFRYRGKSFLHTGDSRSDFIMEALISAGLMTRDGRAHVNVLLMPHLGSNRNLSADFLKRVTADEYLFTGDGTFGNPETETIAALVAARQCERFTMHFVNRDSTTPFIPSGVARTDPNAIMTHGERLNAFFAEENKSNPSYRRFFRSPDGGSVFIDLLDRVTY